ncbi:MAG: phospholipid carrier-dependent glycosyltransferase [Candidatus Saccharimonadales bacterium]
MKWHQRLVRYPEIWILSGLGLVTRLWQLGLPPAVVFDEVYFRKFAADYLSGQYFFDIHPPLVKLFFAGIGSLAHLTPEQLGGSDVSGLIVRYLPAIVGALLVPLVYVILRQLHLGRRVATIGAVLILCDNALLVESRFVLMDSILLFAGIGSLSAYLVLRQKRNNWSWAWVSIMALLLGILVSIKWTGLAVSGVVLFAWLTECIVNRVNWKRILGETAIILAIIPTVYIGSFMIHFNLLDKSGEGDAFMSQHFQSTLKGNQYYTESARMSFWDKFVELNGEMYSAQSTLKGIEHPYASKWYTWPFEIRTVYYWQGNMQQNGMQGNIYLLGNPLVWFTGAASVVAALMLLVIKPRWLGKRYNLVAFLLVAYIANFVPFAFIDRPMFLYHYLFSLIFSIFIACVLLSLFFDWQVKKYGKTVFNQTFWAIIAAVVLSFLYFLPLSYGWPLSQADLQQRMWLPTWR